MEQVTQERSRQIGRALMVVAALKFLIGLRTAGRVPLILAPLVALVAALAAGILLWIGYTMATKNWDDPADWPPTSDAL